MDEVVLETPQEGTALAMRSPQVHPGTTTGQSHYRQVAERSGEELQSEPKQQLAGAAQKDPLGAAYGFPVSEGQQQQQQQQLQDLMLLLGNAVAAVAASGSSPSREAIRASAIKQRIAAGV